MNRLEQFQRLKQTNEPTEFVRNLGFGHLAARTFSAARAIGHEFAWTRTWLGLICCAV